ncbi:MAG TPA: acetate/propionate family kinase [Candidatus Angelobacter sp.]|nr:acetate/propionate family kinase [Candidatus Angelobacter sp.]
MGLDLLCINAGSSSLKFAVFRMGDRGEQKQLSGEVEDIGENRGRFRLRGQDGKPLADQLGKFTDHELAVEAMLGGLAGQGTREFAAAGHRVVHGGPDFFAPQKIDDRLRSRLRQLIPFAPLHLPAQIAMMEAVAGRWPNLPQVACFDTAFHHGLPEVARRFPLPRELWDRGVFRYGFHGLSYEYVVSALGSKLGRRAIVAHLGNGASMVALRDGFPIDTSMGMTPDGGFMMGTRSGDLDPGILLYLLRQGWSGERLARMLEHESGLTGVSGGISDVKTLLEQGDGDVRHTQAVEMFCYQVRKFVGAYAAALGGLDMLVFTGGIGERAAAVRAGICRGLEFLGIEVDPAGNARHAEDISVPGSRCRVFVVHTDEDVMIARHTRNVISDSRSK